MNVCQRLRSEMWKKKWPGMDIYFDGIFRTNVNKDKFYPEVWHDGMLRRDLQRSFWGM